MKPMNWIRNLSFRSKIYFGMIFAAMVPMALGYLLMLQVFQMTYRNNLASEADSILKSTETVLENTFSDIYKVLNELSEDPTIQNKMERPHAGDVPAYRALYTATRPCSNQAAFSLYDKEGRLTTSIATNEYIKDKLPLDWGILFEAQNHPDDLIVRNARIYQGTDRIVYLRLGKAVRGTKGEVVGYVVAVILKENFDEMFDGVAKDRQGVIYLVDDFDEDIYCSANVFDQNFFRETKHSLYGKPQTSDTENVYYKNYMSVSRLTLFYQQPVGSLNSMRKQVTQTAALCAVASLLICLGFASYFSRQVYQPVKQMQEGMAQIEQGNFDVNLTVKIDDELGSLMKSFNRMARNLSDNMKRLIMREQELSATHIKMMQAQLNPHFLYNTLDTMKWLGKANDVPEVAVMASDLAKVLRMSISSRPVIMLKEEIDMVEAYVEIQKIRFADKFEFVVDVPENLEDCLVPKLVLQPIVENAIIHGFAESTNGMVLVEAVQMHMTDPESLEAYDQLEIMVKDDGAGMDERTLDRLNRYAQEPERRKEEKKSIGFCNVADIIRLNYGKRYGVSIDSEQGRGTTVILRLPIRRGAEHTGIENT